MWSGKGKLSLGSKEKPAEGGLAGKIAARVKEEAIGVWSGKEKTPPGSKGKPRECGLASKTAAWVKETPPRKVINKKMKENERT